MNTSYSQFLKQNASLKDKLAEVKVLNESLLEIDTFQRFARVDSTHLESKIKLKSISYRNIFFGISIFYFILSVIIYLKTTNFACGWYFGDCSMIKEYINGVCLFLAISAYSIGLWFKPETISIKELIGKVETKFSESSYLITKKVVETLKSLSDQLTYF
ncbi:MAG: hypothetical protein Q8K92_09445 [Leadbetterella sp.]|nr:hypothetical protein [Leadbetterella sp.]